MRQLWEAPGTAAIAAKDPTPPHPPLLRLRRLPVFLSRMGSASLHKFTVTRQYATEQRTPKKRTRQLPPQTPSQVLISALEDSGCQVELGRPKHYHADCSWFDPIQSTARRRTKLSSLSFRKPQRVRLSFATVVANYIRVVHPLLQQGSPQILSQTDQNELDQALLTVFDDETLLYLSKRGYEPEDVMVWAWILTPSRTLKAALRYEVFEEQILDASSGRARVPLFVLLFILRRADVDSTVFRLLLHQTVSSLSARYIGGSAEENCSIQTSVNGFSSRIHTWDQSGDENTFVILIIRLLRHARQVGPLAFPVIATLITSILGRDSVEGLSYMAYERKSRRLTSLYNTFLNLISVPPPGKPYLFAECQQRAQFQLLREMAKFHPPLIVTRKGYHAITKIQLAQKKTASEREWANYKAQSWPPWKEEKLGIDFERGNGGSESRALKSIQHMAAAGYAKTPWEQTATVYAGWDTDKTPTIQTRIILPDTASLRIASLPASATKQLTETYTANADEIPIAVWSARIRATRTLKEAWACFLSYQDNGLAPHKDIYSAMAEKIIFYSLAQKRDPKSPADAVPGDGKEVFAEPKSPRDVIYVHTEPPTLDNLLREMHSQGVRPSRRLFILLLTHAKTFESGIEYLLDSSMPKEFKYALAAGLSGDHFFNAHCLDGIPQDIFAAFIFHLCKFGTLNEPSTSSKPLLLQQLFPILFAEKVPDKQQIPAGHFPMDTVFHQSRALRQAVQLMKSRMIRYPPAWHHLMSGLSSNRDAYVNGVPTAMEAVIAWWEVGEIVYIMRGADIPLETKGFAICCSAFARLILAAQRDMLGVRKGLETIQIYRKGDSGSLSSPRAFSNFHQVVKRGIKLLKRLFKRVVGMDEKQPTPLSRPGGSPKSSTVNSVPITLPNVVDIPSPDQLHAFVRALGLAQDFNGLVDLLQWISENEAGIESIARERVGGHRMMRRVVVAIRVFLEIGLESSPSLSEAPLFGTDVSSTPEPFAPEMEESDQGNWDGFGDGESPTEPADPLYQEAKRIINDTELLSPWPTDQEIREYVDAGPKILI
ncbi:hypothetical protein FQN51_004302 [Onygenales sp. PD_10]|nr:hypothetical protein FQN51_004302 [Onygenales sp. PD_10]